MSIGYACILLGREDTKMSRCLLKNATEDRLRSITQANLAALSNIIDYNIENNIMLYRISSDIIPFATHQVNNIEWWEDYYDILNAIGVKIKNSGMRVSVHPGQYTVINSPDGDVVKRAIEELKYHNRLLECMGLDNTHKLILHVGGVYGDKNLAMDRFQNNFYKLPQEVKERLVIENDERNYNIGEVLGLSYNTGIPVVLDTLHHSINADDNRGLYDWIRICSSTWHNEDGRQKIHYSQQDRDGRSGYHSKTIDTAEFIKFYNGLVDNGLDDVDIMLEVKDKNLSALKCINLTSLSIPKKVLEEEWARYKYLVLSFSHRKYNDIREILKQDSISPMRFYAEIDEAIKMPEDMGAQKNAALHIWGYFKDIATDTEKREFFKRLEKYMEGGSVDSLKRYLYRLAKKYNEEYLMNSYYFFVH